MENNINFVCNNCPRHCTVDKNRTKSFCGETNQMRIAKYMLHYWEEPIISEKNGSGAIFFSGCNLKCIFCQNYEISNNKIGKIISKYDLVDIFKELESMGANNINLVTPTHFCYQILEALKIYKPKIPVVYNCGGYEDYESIVALKDYIDIWLVDLKYYSNEYSKKLSNVNDYFSIASKNVKFMRKLQPRNIISNGLMKKGVIIRHLILPTLTSDSVELAKWLDNNIDSDCYISLMSQYTPCFKALDTPPFNRPITKLEYKRVVEYYKNNTHFENIFTQELSSSNTDYIPDFNNKKTQ